LTASEPRVLLDDLFVTDGRGTRRGACSCSPKAKRWLLALTRKCPYAQMPLRANDERLAFADSFAIALGYLVASPKALHREVGNTMRIRRGLATAVIFAGTAVGIACPAHADDFGGAYVQTGPGTQSTWVVTPCGPGCAHVADSSGWSADAHLFNGQWTFPIDRPDGTRCNNGSRAPGTLTYSVNAAGNSGTVVTSGAAPCDLAPGYASPIYFILTKVP